MLALSIMTNRVVDGDCGVENFGGIREWRDVD
jgi:hypothetical protein